MNQARILKTEAKYKLYFGRRYGYVCVSYKKGKWGISLAKHNEEDPNRCLEYKAWLADMSLMGIEE